MGCITITTSDADKMLRYFRNELEGRQRGYQMFVDHVNMYSEAEIKKINGLDPDGIVARMVKQVAMNDARKVHEEKTKTILSFIEILTCGSEEGNFDSKSTC